MDKGEGSVAPTEEKKYTAEGGVVDFMSKNQQKRIKRDMKWKEKQKILKEQNKGKYRAKTRVNKDNRKANYKAIKEHIIKRIDPRTGEEVEGIISNKEKKDRWIKLIKEKGQKIVVDCDFEDKMIPRDLTSLNQQIMFSWSENKKSEVPANLLLTGLKDPKEGGVLRKKLNVIGLESWDMENHSECYTEVFKDHKKEDLVYLTADSPNTITELDNSKVYIIGGLVDHNQHKGICYKKAQAQGISHGKFPIKEHVSIGDYSTVLTVNHVVALMLAQLEKKDWKEALTSALPPRKRQKKVGTTAKQSMKREKNTEEPVEESKE